MRRRILASRKLSTVSAVATSDGVTFSRAAVYGSRRHLFFRSHETSCVLLVSNYMDTESVHVADNGMNERCKITVSLTPTINMRTQNVWFLFSNDCQWQI